MDLESSGLPAPGCRPKITELSFVGVLVDHLKQTRKGGGLPRVLQKLNLCFYPQKMIEFEATEITGLDNLALEEIPPWNKEACSLLSSFLQRLPPPVCLVAHNGMRFDFQLLKSEITAKNEVLLENIACADSLLAFRAIFPISRSSVVPIKGAQSSPISGSSTLSCHQLEIERTHSSELLHDTESLMNGKEVNLVPNHSNFSSVNDLQKANETTPKQLKRSGDFINAPPLKKSNSDSSCENPEGRNTMIRKKLFGGNLKSHKLIDIYRHIHHKDLDDGHRAENDSMALLECIAHTAPEFLAWIENNHLQFTKIPCMW